MIADSFPDISFIDDATVDEVLTGMINDYQEKYREITGKEAPLAKANPYRLIMYACTMQIYQAMQYADYAGKMSFLTYARGEFLDNLAALRGVRRMENAAAATILQFSIANPIESAVSIPAGCRVTNGNGIYFATDEYAEISAGGTSVTVPATCTAAGVVGNGFAAGEFSVLVNTLPYIISVTNTVATYGGADREDDESLKERVYSYPNSYSTAGPIGAYEYYAKTASSGIGDVVVRSDVPGEVDVCFICDNGEIPGEALIKKVKDCLDDRSVRPLTDKVTVRAPAVMEYDIRMIYYIPFSSRSAVASIQANVDTAVSIYNTWQTERIGRDINPSYLIQRVMEAGAKRVVVESPVFTVLDESTVAKTGTVTVDFGGVEDD
ncbi:baseplate J/gp47 family protein [bacterium D16-50]|nr:baseplate J/gp47 family protein [bacterium D16-50]